MLSDRIETVGKNRDMYHFFTKTFSEKSFWTRSDQIETVGKNRFLPSWRIFFYIGIILAITISEKSFQTLSDRIESRQNIHVSTCQNIQTLSILDNLHT